MPVELATAYVTLIPSATGMQAAIGKELAGTETVAAAAGRRAGSAFSSPFVKLAATAAVVKFGKDSIAAASDLQEAGSKNLAVFEQLSGSVEKWAKGSADAFGISNAAALEAAGTYGNLFRAFGVGLPDAREMSTTLVELASDLASFNNTSVEDALQALQSGLSGETEPLKRYGVALNDMRLKEIAAAKGIYDGKGALDAKQKALAAYELIMQDTVLAQGDYQRNADGFANRTKTMSARVENLKASLGQALLPIVSKVVEVLSEGVLPVVLALTEAFSALPEGVQTGIVAFAAVAGGAVLLSKAIGGLSSAFTLLAANPWVLALVAAVAIGYVIWRNWDTITAGIAAAWDWVAEKAALVWGFVRDFLGEVWNAIYTTVSTAATFVTETVVGAWNWISTTTSTVWNAIKTFFQTWWPALLAIFTGPIGLIVALIVRNWDTIWSKTQQVFAAVRGFLSGVLSTIAGLFRTYIINPIQTVIEFFGRLPGAASSAWNAVLGVIRGVVGAIIGVVDRMRSAVSSAVSAINGLTSLDIGGTIGSALSFDTGGVVPGPIGAPTLALVHGGETILPTHKAGFRRDLEVGTAAVAGSSGPTSVVHNDFRGITVRDDSDLDAIVRAVNRSKRARGTVVGSYGTEGLNW